MLRKLKIKTCFRKDPLFQAAGKIVRILREHQYKAFFAGGAARDLLLGKTPHDIDIATSAEPDRIQQIFEKTYALGAAFGVITIHMDGFQFETATFRQEREYLDGRRPEQILYTDNEQLDVERRDFTINGMLYDPLEEEILDYVGGLSDLQNGTIRTIGNPDQRFSEDYLRILRGIRFKARFAFEWDPPTAEAVRANARKLNVLSKERVRDELEKMLLGPHPSEAFRSMRELGVLKVILPEIQALYQVEQPPQFHPEGDVFTHTMIMLERMCHPTRELAWSVLLHDVGKPVTQGRKENGVIHFYGHEKAGEGMSEAILRRLKLPGKTIEQVAKAVACHMKFAAVDKMKRATWLKMIYEPTFPTEMELHRVDCASCHGKLENYILMLDRLAELNHATSRPEPPKAFLNGTDLKQYGIKPGPRMGEILSALRDAQLEGTVKSKEEALQFLNRMESL